MKGLLDTVRTIIRLIVMFDARQFRVIIALSGIGAFLDLAGIASIAPFLSLVSNPGIIDGNPYLSWLYGSLGFVDDRNFLMFIGALTIIFLLIFAALRALIAYRSTFFIHRQRHNISTTLFKSGFYTPLAISADQHSSVITSRVFGETDVFIDSAVRPLIELLVSGVLVLSILVMLFIINPLTMIIILLFLAAFFGVMILATKNAILRSGKERAAANAKRYKLLKEALSGALELRLLGREALYISRFCEASEHFARSVASNQALLQLTTYAIQALTFGGVIALTIGLLGGQTELSDIAPLLGLYLFAGYRLMPAANICFSAVSTLRYAQPAVEAIRHGISNDPDVAQVSGRSLTSDFPRGAQESGYRKNISCRKGIRMEDISFSYESGGGDLEIASLEFPAGKIIGVVGPSGSGKSTFFSLLLGLREPQRGRIFIDDIELNAKTMRSWHDTIGFVGQRPFVSDDTIAANISLGLPEEARKVDAIEKAARLAHADEFIARLPAGLMTLAGEDGERLSGGQRQRVSIARALYHEPSVLFLDEVTSALDHRAEMEIKSAVAGMKGERTIFLISHRPALLEICDLILSLDNGQPVAFGPAEEILRGEEVLKT